MSPGMSVMHFSQKVYLSENKLGVGFLQDGGSLKSIVKMLCQDDCLKIDEHS